VQPLLSIEIKTRRLPKAAGDNRGWRPARDASRGFLSIRNDPPRFHSASLRSVWGGGQNSKSVGNGGTLSTWRFSTAV